MLSRQLLDRGVIREISTRQNQQRQGRPVVLLDLNPTYGYFVGARIDEAPLLMSLIDLKGNVIQCHKVTLPETVDEIANALHEGAEGLVNSARIQNDRVMGLGIAISGVVDHANGVCRHSAILGWHDVPIASIVSKATSLPTYLENNANAVATGEKLFGDARGHDNFSIVTFGRGIGGAHYIEGHLYRGHSGGAGEIAHCTIDLDGRLCKCGKRGCLDTIASREAILQAAHGCNLDVNTLADIESLAIVGNREAIDILKRAGRALGLAVAHIININDPELVIITGIDASLGTLLMTSTRQAIENLILPRLLASTRLEFRHVNGEVWARGAASIAARSLLTGKSLPNSWERSY